MLQIDQMDGPRDAVDRKIVGSHVEKVGSYQRGDSTDGETGDGLWFQRPQNAGTHIQIFMSAHITAEEARLGVRIPASREDTILSLVFDSRKIACKHTLSREPSKKLE